MDCVLRDGQRQRPGPPPSAEYAQETLLIPVISWVINFHESLTDNVTDPFISYNFEGGWKTQGSISEHRVPCSFVFLGELWF